MLPRIKEPLFDLTIPTTKQDAKFRPFLVKEEKLLLIAQAGGTKKEMVNSLKQVINNCVILNNGARLDVNSLTTFDIEFIFVKIRSKSVDNIVNVSYIDHEDEKSYDFKINLDEIQIQYNPDHTNKIIVNNEINLLMKYPTVDIIGKSDNPSITALDLSLEMIADCIDKIYDKEKVYLPSECEPGELNEFIDSLSIAAFGQIQKFFETMPRVYYKIEYENSKGTKRVIELSSLDDFFRLA